MDLTNGIDAAVLDKGRTAEHYDEDGWPTDAAFNLIKHWQYDDPTGWIKFIHSVWHLRDFGFHTEQCITDHWSGHKLQATQVHLSTVGWSGNEAIIRTMQLNSDLWDELWQSSCRGGHHIFEIAWEEIPE